MIIYTTAQTDQDLNAILDLQKANLPFSLTAEEIVTQGFLTVVYSVDDLRRMNEIEPHVIAKKDACVVAYLLAMTKASKEDIPILRPMFEMFDTIQFNGLPVSFYRYVVVGQVCVDKKFRGQGILDNCYMAYKNFYQPRFDFAITEIATRNTRSINAHKRIGFEEIHCFTAADGEEWLIVVWNWNGQ